MVGWFVFYFSLNFWFNGLVIGFRLDMNKEMNISFSVTNLQQKEN